MRTFTFSVTPERTHDGDLRCNLTIVKCIDKELLANAQYYMNQGLSSALLANPDLYSTLESLVDKNSSIVLRFILTFDEKYDIIINNELIGKVEIKTPIKVVETHQRIRDVISEFLAEIERILYDEKEIRKSTDTESITSSNPQEC